MEGRSITGGCFYQKDSSVMDLQQNQTEDLMTFSLNNFLSCRLSGKLSATCAAWFQTKFKSTFSFVFYFSLIKFLIWFCFLPAPVWLRTQSRSEPPPDSVSPRCRRWMLGSGPARRRCSPWPSSGPCQPWPPRSPRCCRRCCCWFWPGSCGASAGAWPGTRTAACRCRGAPWAGRWSERPSTGSSRSEPPSLSPEPGVEPQPLFKHHSSRWKLRVQVFSATCADLTSVSGAARTGSFRFSSVRFFSLSISPSLLPFCAENETDPVSLYASLSYFQFFSLH